MADTKVNTAKKHIEYALQDLEKYVAPDSRGPYATTKAKIAQMLDSAELIVQTLEQYLYSDDVCDSQVQERCTNDEPCESDVAWISQSDAMPSFKPKTPVSVTVEILTSNNKAVKAIYDARVSIWLSAEEWYKPEQVVGWRNLS